jgi:hypothetical protein
MVPVEEALALHVDTDDTVLAEVVVEERRVPSLLASLSVGVKGTGDFIGRL